MNIYRHKQNKKLYTITHIVYDMYHLNANVDDYRMGKIKEFNPLKFVDDNFEIVSERMKIENGYGILKWLFKIR